MAYSEDIIHEIFVLLKGCGRGYVTDEHFKKVCRTNATLLRRIGRYFSFLRQVESTHERIREARDFVDASMNIWHNIGFSVTPKAHIFEDHTIESM